MQGLAILDAVGTLASLGAEAAAAREAERERIRAQAQAAWRAYLESLEGMWATIDADDKEMAALAKPLPPPASPAPPAAPPAPSSPPAP